MPLVMGIDPGQAGGVAILGDTPSLAVVCAMPLLFKGDVDFVALDRWIYTNVGIPSQIALAILEKAQGMPGQNCNSVFNFGDHYGQLKAYLRMKLYSHQLATPQSWKGKILVGTAKDKAAAIQHCVNRYPHLLPTLNVGKKKVIYHDGMADALCIAEFGRLLLNGGSTPT